MSINVPEKLSKQEYNGLLNDLKKFDLTKYTDLIKIIKSQKEKQSIP